MNVYLRRSTLLLEIIKKALEVNIELPKEP